MTIKHSKKKFILIFFSALIFSRITPKADASTGYLGIIPGLGHVTNGQTLEGIGWLSATIAGAVFGSIEKTAPNLGFNIWMYQMYDAYQDSGGTPVSKNNPFTNYIAVVNPLNLLAPVSTPFLFAATASKWSKGNFSNVTAQRIAAYGFVGWSEEALFRGFLYPSWSNFFGSRGVGAITSSIFFAAAHFEFAPAPMAFRTLAGLAYCWQVGIDKYDLRKSIFSHAWLDVFVADSKISGPRSKQIGNGAALNFKLDF